MTAQTNYATYIKRTIIYQKKKKKERKKTSNRKRTLHSYCQLKEANLKRLCTVISTICYFRKWNHGDGEKIGGSQGLRRRRQWQPTPVLLPGKFHELRSLIGYSPWGRKESDMTLWSEVTSPHFIHKVICPCVYLCVQRPCWWVVLRILVQFFWMPFWK